MRKLLIMLCVLAVAGESFGQATAPKYSNEFLAIGVGARALGMSGAAVASTKDVTAGYWNPAGLMGMEHKYEASLMHAEYFAGIAQYDYGSFATAIDSNSRLGVTVIRFGVDDIPDTRFLYEGDNINYDRIRFFSAADYAFMVHYARKSNLIEGLSLGGTVKVVHRTVGEFANAWGFGLDAGAQLERGNWQFGVMARDVTGTFNAWALNTAVLTENDVYALTGNTIPSNSVEVTLPKLQLGAGHGVRIREDFGVLVELNADLTFDGRRNVPISSDFVSIEPKGGLELDYKRIVFLRGGMGNVQEIKNFDATTYTSVQPNFGVGVNIKAFTIDYALTDIGNFSESLYSHVFSVKVSLN